MRALATAAAAALMLAPAAAADQRSRIRDGQRQADAAARQLARTVSAYHERVGGCYRTSVPESTNGPRVKATVCRYRLAGFDKTGEHYTCRFRVVVKDGRPFELIGCPGA